MNLNYIIIGVILLLILTACGPNTEQQPTPTTNEFGMYIEEDPTPDYRHKETYYEDSFDMQDAAIGALAGAALQGALSSPQKEVIIKEKTVYKEKPSAIKKIKKKKLYNKTPSRYNKSRKTYRSFNKYRR